MDDIKKGMLSSALWCLKTQGLNNYLYWGNNTHGSVTSKIPSNSIIGATITTWIAVPYQWFSSTNDFMIYNNSRFSIHILRFQSNGQEPMIKNCNSHSECQCTLPWHLLIWGACSTLAFWSEDLLMWVWIWCRRLHVLWNPQTIFLKVYAQKLHLN